MGHKHTAAETTEGESALGFWPLFWRTTQYTSPTSRSIHRTPHQVRPLVKRQSIMVENFPSCQSRVETMLYQHLLHASAPRYLVAFAAKGYCPQQSTVSRPISKSYLVLKRKCGDASIPGWPLQLREVGWGRGPCWCLVYQMGPNQGTPCTGLQLLFCPTG